MIKINLLPPEYIQAQKKKEQQIIFGSVGGFIFLILIGFWGIKKVQAARLEKDITVAEAELKKFQVILDQIDNIEKNKARLTAKRDVIKNLNRSRLLYPVFFEDLLPIIPSNVWVGSIQISESGSSFNVTMQSKALSNFALASWLTNLEQSPHFSGVELGPISYSKSGDGPPTLSFNLKANYQHKGPMPLSEFY